MIFYIWKIIKISIFSVIIIKFIYYQRESNSTIKNSIPFNSIKLIYPRVSIIIPVYNTDKYLKDCLDSLLNQTLKEIEIICIDDGSTDNSLSILKEYAKIDNRIIILKQNNKGAGVARNYGMSIAKGEYLLFLDSDDFFNENLLYDTVNVGDNTLVDIVVFLFQIYKNNNIAYNNETYGVYGFIKKNCTNLIFNYHMEPNNFFLNFNPAPWNKLFRHSFIKKHGLYFQNNRRTNDLYFTMTSLISTKKIYFLDKVLVYYRIDLINNSQSTNSYYPFDFYKSLLALKRFLKEKNLFSQLKESYKNLVGNITIYNLNQNKENNILVYEELKREGFKNMEIDFIPSWKISWRFHEKYEKYIDNIYFKHLNLADENFEIKIIKKANYLFKPKVSIIIPIYNEEKYIIQCLDSITKQTLKEIEIIIVNDGSTDNSLNVIKKYSMNDNRIQIISQTNRGQSEARNTGIKYSNGEYIYFIDGDDYLELNTLSDLYNKAIQNNLDIILFDASSFSNEINPIIIEGKLKYYNNFFSRRNNYSIILNGKEMFLKMKQKGDYNPYVCLQFYKKQFYINIGLSFFPGILNQDHLFTLISLLNANKTSHIKHNYYKYRVKLNSISKTYNINDLYGYLIIYCEIQKLMENYNIKYELKSAIMKEIRDIEEKILKISNLIPEEQKNHLLKKITIFQEIQYKKIIQINDGLKITIKKLKKKNKIFLSIIFLLLIILLISIFLKFF